jgi:ABC-type sulfate/molybdate transport systems ATPase subunit
LLKAQEIVITSNDEVPIINGISLSLKGGEILGIVGRSGAGKSTLLRAISGKMNYDGVIYLDDERQLKPSEKLVAGNRNIALVTQHFSENLYFTVRENVQNSLLHWQQLERQKKVKKLLQVFDLEPAADKKSGELSGGEQQRVALACAIARNPRLLLLDEPFTHLDVHLKHKISNYIQTLVEQNNMMVIIVSHLGEEILSWANRIMHLKNGKLSASKTPEQVYFRPKSKEIGAFYGEINQIKCEGKTLLFRPNDYELQQDNVYCKALSVAWKLSDFRGHYYANYFETTASRGHIVIYAQKALNEVKLIYVREKENS